jgi:hypothetical protein
MSYRCVPVSNAQVQLRAVDDLGPEQVTYQDTLKPLNRNASDVLAPDRCSGLSVCAAREAGTHVQGLNPHSRGS